MMKKTGYVVLLTSLCLGISFFPPGLFSQVKTDIELDEKVKNFLESHRYRWRDMNVSEEDGKVLYDLVVENNYTKA